MHLVVSGLHDPEGIIGKHVGTKRMAKDRHRVHRECDRTAVGEISYEATLDPLFCMNNIPWETVVYWTDVRHPLVFPYKEVEFFDQLGRGCRRKRQTQFLGDEQDPVRGRTRVKTGDGKAKARKQFNNVLRNTSNKE